MKQLPVGKFFALLFGLLILVIFTAGIFTGQFGKIIGGRTANLTKSQSSSTYELKDKKKIRKIRISKDNRGGCMEVSPDGAVRIYDVCGETLTDAVRLTETKNILKLFKLVSETKLEEFTNKPEGTYVIIIVETDTGTETYYLPQDTGPGGGSGGGAIGDIIDTIDDIEEDIPDPTPTPTLIPSPTDIITGGESPTPASGVSPTNILYPTPTQAQTLVPFTCDFTGTSGTKKPYNVSNYICSTEPTPQVR